MILSYAKLFNKKICKPLMKIWDKRKKDVSNFSTVSIYDMIAKKSHKFVFLVQTYSVLAKKNATFTQQPKRPSTLLKRHSNTGVFL